MAAARSDDLVSVGAALAFVSSPLSPYEDPPCWSGSFLRGPGCSACFCWVDEPCSWGLDVAGWAPSEGSPYPDANRARNKVGGTGRIIGRKRIECTRYDLRNDIVSRGAVGVAEKSAVQVKAVWVEIMT